MIELNKQILILIGHYGTGKTTLSLNTAMNYSEESAKPLALVDLDVNNPYFRSRDWLDALDKRQIEVIMPKKEIAFAEMPYLPKEVYSIIHDPTRKVIIDVGGHDVGTTVLGSIADKIEKVDFDLFMVINTYRPDMGSAEEIVQMLERLQGLSKLKITGLINNTNLGTLTQVEDLIESEKIVQAVSDYTGIPFIGTAVENQLLEKSKEVLKSSIIPLKRFDLYNFR